MRRQRPACGTAGMASRRRSPAASNADDFAQSLLQLYAAETLWTDIRNGALKTVERDYNDKVFAASLSDSLEQALKTPLQGANADPLNLTKTGIEIPVPVIVTT